MTELSNCLTVPASTCSLLDYAAVFDPSNWWILLGIFAGALVMVAIKSTTDNQSHNMFSEPLIYTAISVFLVFVLVRLGISAFFLNYLVSRPAGYLSFISLILCGGVTAFVGDEIFTGGGKTGLKEAQRILSANPDITNIRTTATEKIPAVIGDLWIPIVMVLFIFIVVIIKQFRT